jgi:hypothetical protein
MGTRSTHTVGVATATRAVEAALQSGNLTHEALSWMLQAVADDITSYGSYNFTIVDGQGEDDAMWEPR